MNYKKYNQDCADFLQKLIQTPSVNGVHNEKSVIELTIQEAKKLGLPTRIIEMEPGRPNLFVGEGFDNEDGLLLVSHADTVPPGDESAWDQPPFAGNIVDGKLYGRGALDCKGGLAISLYTLKALADQGKSHQAKMLVGADEESGADSQFGIRAVLSEGLKAKGAVYTYGGKPTNEVIIGHRGLVRLWVNCQGESTHSGSREWQDRTKGESAIDGLIDFILAVKTVKTQSQHQYFPGYASTITTTLIKGGEGESLVPSGAKALLDIRTLPGDNESILNQLDRLKDALSTDKRRYVLEIKNDIPAIVSDSNSQIVLETIRLKGELQGFQNPLLKGSGPANESYMLIKAGIPTITGFGATGQGFHSANEYAEVDNLYKSIEFLATLSSCLAN